jgi:DNA-binding XRE family transcriptional regulator
MAEQVGISRTTLLSVEASAASPAIGTHLKVLAMLGLADDLVLVATGEGAANERS